MLKLKMLHSLEKVFPQKEPDGALAASSLFQNERFSWQAAFFADKENWGRCEAAVTVEGPWTDRGRRSPPGSIRSAFR